MEAFGYLNGNEFVITSRLTPAPWANYLTNDRYHAIVSSTGGGMSYLDSPKDVRLFRFRYNSLPEDRPGRCIYIRDAGSGEYFSPTWEPARGDVDSFKCIHGMASSRFLISKGSFETTLEMFVPEKAFFEVWLLRIRNTGDTGKKLSIIAYLELLMGHALNDLINQPNDQHFVDVRFSKKLNAILGTRRYWVTFNGPTVRQANSDWPYEAFLWSSLPVRSYETRRDEFIGPGRSETDPLMVEKGRLGNRNTDSGHPCAAIENRIHLPAGGEIEIVFLAGIVEKPCIEEKLEKIFEEYREPCFARKALEKTEDWWKSIQRSLEIKVPDRKASTMLSSWHQKQAITTFRCSRNASYYHGGLLFGRGFRDACQDVLGVLHNGALSGEVRARLLELAGKFFQDGSCYHCYYPVTGGGERTGHSDTPLWYSIALAEYIRETADAAFLFEEVPFEDGGRASVLEHALRGLFYTLSMKGHHGLPRIGSGDWNDTLDYLGREQKGSSVLVAMQVVYAIRTLVGALKDAESTSAGVVQKLLPYAARIKKLIREALRLEQTLNEKCWDGDSYVRAFRDDGRVVGSASKDGHVFLNTQSWAILSGIADKDKIARLIETVRRRFDSPRGPKMLDPAYREIDPAIGLITRCVPGKKENGAIFNHTVSWLVLAEAVSGYEDEAWRHYLQTLPLNQAGSTAKSRAHYRMEPYVYSEYVTSMEHPDFGRASHSWLTGTAAWMLFAITRGILGLVPSAKGLTFVPHIPSTWKGFEVKRFFRGATYHIKGRSDRRISSPVLYRLLSKDGAHEYRKVEIRDSVIPLLSEGETAFYEYLFPVKKQRKS